MDTLNAVSETALITLKSRVQEAEKDEPVIRDEVAQECLAKIRPLLPIETQNRVLNRNLPATLTRHIALRACKYDAYAKAFIAENQSGLVVSLGCGFDTRYWRVSDNAWNYIEVDLPEVIGAKKKILGDRLTYQMIGGSILDEGWIEEVRSIQEENILFLAEGLLMYLPQVEVVGLFNKLARSFSKSEIVFEVVNKRYTKGLWKKSVESKMKRSVEGFIQRLPPDYRAVLVLHDLQGLKNREIAEALDIPLSTVKIRLHRARNKLREALDTGCDTTHDERNILVCEPKVENGKENER